MLEKYQPILIVAARKSLLPTYQHDVCFRRDSHLRRRQGQRVFSGCDEFFVCRVRKSGLVMLHEGRVLGIGVLRMSSPAYSLLLCRHPLYTPMLFEMVFLSVGSAYHAQQKRYPYPPLQPLYPPSHSLPASPVSSAYRQSDPPSPMAYRANPGNPSPAGNRLATILLGSLGVHKNGKLVEGSPC